MVCEKPLPKGVWDGKGVRIRWVWGSNIIHKCTKHVNLPPIQISLIPTFLTLAWFELQNLSNENAIYPKRCLDMKVKSK